MKAFVAVIVAIAGVLMYALSTNAKLAEIGRLLFFAATLALMFVFAMHTVKLL